MGLHGLHNMPCSGASTPAHQQIAPSGSHRGRAAAGKRGVWAVEGVHGLPRAVEKVGWAKGGV